MGRLIECALVGALALGCGASGQWRATAGADPNADGRCTAQAEAGTDTYTCKGMSACLAENMRWGNIYRACMRGSGYVWVEDAPKPEPIAEERRDP